MSCTQFHSIKLFILRQTSICYRQDQPGNFFKEKALNLRELSIIKGKALKVHVPRTAPISAKHPLTCRSHVLTNMQRINQFPHP